RHLGEARHRVGAAHPLSAARAKLELVGVAGRKARNEQLPDAAVAESAHGVADAVPAVEVADDARGRRVRGPDAEARARDLLVWAEVSAEDLPELFVPALAPEVEVDVAHRWHEAVRVVGDPVRAVVVAGLERVRLAVSGGEALPQPFCKVRQGDAAGIRPHRGHRCRERSQGPDDEAAVDGMLPEGLVWIRMAAAGDRGDQ